MLKSGTFPRYMEFTINGYDEGPEYDGAEAIMRAIDDMKNEIFEQLLIQHGYALPIGNLKPSKAVNIVLKFDLEANKGIYRIGIQSPTEKDAAPHPLGKQVNTSSSVIFINEEHAAQIVMALSYKHRETIVQLLVAAREIQEITKVEQDEDATELHRKMQTERIRETADAIRQTLLPEQYSPLNEAIVAPPASLDWLPQKPENEGDNLAFVSVLKSLKQVLEKNPDTPKEWLRLFDVDPEERDTRYVYDIDPDTSEITLELRMEYVQTDQQAGISRLDTASNTFPMPLILEALDALAQPENEWGAQDRETFARSFAHDALKNRAMAMEYGEDFFAEDDCDFRDFSDEMICDLYLRLSGKHTT